MKNIKRKKQKGYTLLEYSAGAAILMGILYVGVNAMGSGIKDLMTGVGSWASQQTSSLPSGTSTTNN